MLFALALCGLAACSRDSVDEVVAVGDGNTANVKLNFSVNSSPEVETRAAQSTYYEYLVQNIYVFVFNGDSRVQLTQDFFEPGNITNYKNKEDGNNSQQSSGTINFGAISGSGLKICAIANIGTSNSVMGSTVTRATASDTGSTGDGSGDVTTDADLAKLDAITSYTELKKLSVELKSNSIFRGASFLMTGEVTANLEANQTTVVTIPLSRTDSKITFNVKAAASANSNISNMEFIPGKWRVVNFPVVSYVLPHIDTDDAAKTLTEDKDATIDASDFFSVSEAEAPQFEGTVGDDTNSGTFTFYMYENLKAPQKNIEGSGAAAYALREKQVKTNIDDTSVTGVAGQKYVNGDFVYAPKFGTYVVFTGELSYTQKDDKDNDQYVIADVEYCVHLGHDSDTYFDCYNTLRNYHYTYNVTITGVNSLVVEVDSDNNSDPDDDQEPRPGAEGDVVISASEIHNVDGHYDRALITLTAEEASNLLFSVSTPFERGVDDMQNDAELKDYKWIKFLINSEVDVAYNSYAAFPGEQCYDGGKSAQGVGATSGAYNNETVVLRDIRQLSNYLRANNPTGNVYITAFVDEYLYFYDPTTDNNVATNDDVTSTTYKGVTTADANGLLMWKQSVNTNDRMLHIVKAGDMKYSADGETSVSRSVVTFKQRPILTFYNVNADGLTSAWGTETINETPKMTVIRDDYPDAQDNYYLTSQYNTALKEVTTSGNWWNPTTTETWNVWADVISSAEQYGLGDDFQDPSYACALRNRDFNGDGTINQNEVQWYLAALTQLSDLYIGEPAMPPYAHLFDAANPDGYYNNYPATHYVTSTIKEVNTSYGKVTTPMVYWAEEYGASSGHANAIDWGQAPLDGSNNAVVSVRCVRNLGKAYTDGTLPQDYILVSNGTPNISSNTNKFSATSNMYHINMDYLNPVALRQTYDNEGPLAYVNLGVTGSQDNSPYKFGFEVRNDYVTTNWWDAYSAEIKMESVCPLGYRMPNQREMFIMTKYLDGWNYTGNYGQYTMFNAQVITTASATEYGVFTYFTGGSNPDRIGRTKGASLQEASNNVGSCVVRCVKDLNSATPSNASTYNNGGSAVQ